MTQVNETVADQVTEQDPENTTNVEIFETKIKFTI